MYTLDYTRRAHRDLRPLTGQPGRYRLRVGDWRVGFTRDREAAALAVLWILPRSRAYRD